MQLDQFPSMPDVTVPTTDADTLAAQIDADEPLTLLDVRMTDEYETWHIEGPSVSTVNIPYIAFLEGEVPPQASEAPPFAPTTVTRASVGSASDACGGTPASGTAQHGRLVV